VYQEEKLGNVVDYSDDYRKQVALAMGVLGLTPFLHKTWCVLLD
jgi:hypothetical protein